MQFRIYTYTMEIMSARDLSRYLKVNEKKVYKLVQEGLVPSLKIGGKISFAKELIDKWILENTEWDERIVLAGSDDVLLRNIIDGYNARQKGLVFYAPVGSINGLRALKQYRATMSCVHIFDPAKKEDDPSYLGKYVELADYVVIRLFQREQGLIVKKHNPKGIKSLRDVVEKKATFINRNQGSGTRLLLDYLLNQAEIDPKGIRGYEVEADSHLQVALSVLTGHSDTGLGIRHAAHMLGLDFVFLFKETFDMVIPRERYYSSHVKAFLAFFDQSSLKQNVKDYAGYETEKSGKVLSAGI